MFCNRCPSVAGPPVIQHETDGEYTIDLAAWSCTRPYAAARATRYGELDFRTICKHLSRLALTRAGVLPACEPHVAALLERGVWIRERRYSPVYETRFFKWSAWPSPVLIGITPQSSWVSVITRQKKATDITPVFTGDYFLFSFTTEERMWAYNTRPPGATALRDLIDSMGRRALLTA